MHAILLAFDIGTSGLKASLIDENLNVLRNVTTTYPTRRLPNGGSEQDPTDWWMSAVRAMLMLRELAPEYVKKVDAIGVSGHMLGCLPMDREGQALRPAMIHADTRALAQALVEALLLHRQYPHQQVLAGLEAALAVGALSPEAVAVEVRRAGETRPQLGLVGGDGHISYPVDTRPLPTVEAYDTLLTGGTPT